MTAKKADHLLLRRKRMVTATMKECKDCKLVKHVSEFYMMRHYDRPGAPPYWASHCKTCAAERERMRRYGATLAEVIFKQGSPICPLCQKRLGVCLDHDHKTGEARGALCQPCNRALHYVENEGWMKRAEQYLAVQEQSPESLPLREPSGDREAVA